MTVRNFSLLEIHVRFVVNCRERAFNLNKCRFLLKIMSNLVEIAVTSDSNGSLWSSCAWDPQAGTQLCTYKGINLKTVQFALIALPISTISQVVERLYRTDLRLSTMNSS